MTRELTLRVSLFCLLLGIYLLSYTPRLDSIDGAATLAVSVSWVQRGSVDIAALGGIDGLLPPVSRMGTFGIDGQLYSKKGVTPSLALLPLVEFAQISGLPMRATAMLLNALITALTGVFVYIVGQQWGFARRSAYLTALLYGVGTLAWVYARTLYGEPVAALLLIVAIAAAQTARNGQRWGYSVVGLALGLICGVNLAYATLLPVVALFLFGLNPRRWQIGAIFRFGAALALIGVFLLGYNMVRFGNAFTSGYNFAQGEGFTAPLLEGAIGLWLSPYRGMLWYSPLLWLGIFSFTRRSFRPFMLLCLSILVMQTLTFGAWWSWHGGVTWGARFLVPVVPLAALLLLPFVEKALTVKRGWLFCLLLVSVISAAVQLLGLLLDYQRYYVYLYRYFFESPITGLSDQVVWDAALSPILGHAALLSAGAPLELMLLAQGLNLPHLLAALSVIGIGLLSAGVHDLTPKSPLRLQRGDLHRWLPFLGCVVVSTALIVILKQQENAPTRLATEYLALQPANTLVVADATIGDALLDMPARVQAISLHAPTPLDDPLAAGLWQNAKTSGGYLWYVNWFAPNHPDNWAERDLWENYAFVREYPLLHYRALLFDVRPPLPADQPAQAQWAEQIELAAYGLGVENEAVRLTLVWRALQVPAANYTWFVHLVDASGQIVAQQDRPPQGNHQPTNTWTATTTLADYVTFPLPPNTNTADWRLRIGWVNPATGELLPLTATPPHLTTEGDFVWVSLATGNGQ